MALPFPIPVASQNRAPQTANQWTSAPATTSPATAQQNFNPNAMAQAIASGMAMQANTANSLVLGDAPFDMLPIPPAFTQTIISNTGAGANAITAYFGNEPFFNATPTNNGSGAASVVNTYGDGWSGKGYNQLISALERGVRFYGFTLSYITTSTGAQNPAGLTTANTTILVADLVGANQIPKGIVINAGLRNTQYQQGTMTVQYTFNLNTLCQFSYSVPVGNTASLTLLTSPLS